MKELIQSVKDFKIIPGNFKSAGELEVVEIDNDFFTAKLSLMDESELSDYPVGSGVEVFGVNSVGLIYFETKILSREKNIIKLALTQDYSIIQRREYSRVGLRQGRIIFKDMPDDTVISVDDISAGGVRLSTNTALNIDKHYDIEISLLNNMKIECALKPIRIVEQPDKTFIISGKFINLENVDRIVLVQYAFKIKMEEQNRKNG